MALYEHVFLARQDMSAQQVDALIEQYKGVIDPSVARLVALKTGASSP